MSGAMTHCPECGLLKPCSTCGGPSKPPLMVVPNSSAPVGLQPGVVTFVPFNGSPVEAGQLLRDLEARAEKAEVRVKELLAEREQQARELKRLQDNNAELRERLNTPTAGVADRIVTSPEFRRFLVDLARLCRPAVDVGSLLALLDREAKR